MVQYEAARASRHCGTPSPASVPPAKSATSNSLFGDMPTALLPVSAKVFTPENFRFVCTKITILKINCKLVGKHWFQIRRSRRVRVTQILRMLRPSRICRKTVYVMALLSSTCAYAQLFTFSKQELIDYTANSPFDRLADGRPKVSDAMIERARELSSEEVWACLHE